jgi:hypothetical protein
MKRILAVTHLIEDEQLEMVRRSLIQQNDATLVTLCTNYEKSLEFSLGVNGSECTVYHEGTPLNPDVVWYATHPRTDALYSQGFRFPGEHRSAMTQLVLDMHYALGSETKWVPGDYDQLCAADSKPFLLSQAVKCGLLTPEETLNGTLPAKNNFTSKKLYKKKLGFPSVISFDRKSKKEVISTTKNKLGDGGARCEIWQWQTPVDSIAHVRCCVVGKKVWSVIWQRRSPVSKLYDYRSQELEEDWCAYMLPVQVESSLKELISRLGIQIACPEFLLRRNGDHVFIDMNPCGDWAGFFSESVNLEISDCVAQLLIS